MSITLRFILNCFSGRTVQWLVLLFAKGRQCSQGASLTRSSDINVHSLGKLALEAIGRFGMRFNER